MAHYRLVIPLKRSRHPPEYTARGVAVGLFWAFTPLVGIQMYLCLMSWLPVRRRALDFNLVVACAWTWVTNVFTMFPIYYVFYVSGQILLGRWDDLSGYQGFVQGWSDIFTEDASLWEAMGDYAKLVALEQGQSLLVGAIPYAFGFGWLGYLWSLAFTRRRREERRRRLEGADVPGPAS